MRVLDDLATVYQARVDAERELAALPAEVRWKPLSGTEYLYEVSSGDWRTSLGARNASTEQIFANRKQSRGQCQARIDAANLRIPVLASLYRGLRLPRVDEMVGKVCREADRRGMLGTQLLMVGTNSMPAYEIEAQALMPAGLNESQDCDFTWCAGAQFAALPLEGVGPRPFFAMLRAVDSTFTPNMERPFQARNASAYEVEILMAPSIARHYPQGEPLRPIPLPEQEWLLLGRPVRHVVLDRKNEPVPLHVPDPRWMALHKLWLADKPERRERSSRKVAKDREQGLSLAHAVTLHMPGFPVDDEFRASVPAELQQYLVHFPR